MYYQTKRKEKRKGCVQMSVERIDFSPISFIVAEDEEEKRIKRRLYFVYGIIPTGQKSVDKERLRQCELRQFRSEKVVSSFYIALPVSEQKKILEQWKQKKIDACNNDPDELKRLGAKTKGEQLYLAIQMKKKQELKQKEERIKAKEIIEKKNNQKKDEKSY